MGDEVAKDARVTAEPISDLKDAVDSTKSEEDPAIELFPGASNWLDAGSSWFSSAREKVVHINIF